MHQCLVSLPAGGHSKEAVHGRTQIALHNKIHTKFAVGFIELTGQTRLKLPHLSFTVVRD